MSVSACATEVKEREAMKQRKCRAATSPMGMRRTHSDAGILSGSRAAQAARPTKPAPKSMRRLVTSTGESSPAQRTRIAPVEKHTVAAAAWATPVNSSRVMGRDANTSRAKSQEPRAEMGAQGRRRGNPP